MSLEIGFQGSCSESSSDSSSDSSNDSCPCLEESSSDDEIDSRFSPEGCPFSFSLYFLNSAQLNNLLTLFPVGVQVDQKDKKVELVCNFPDF